MSTRGIQQSQAVASGKRQIFHAGIGRRLAKLREDKQLSQGQVALRSKGNISEGTLKAIETGRIKNPDPDHLRALAAIYGVPFRSVAEPFIHANYGSDLVRQTGDQQSELPQEGGSSNGATAARILELEQQVTDAETTIREMRDVATRLIKIAAVRAEGGAVERKAPARSSRHRGAGR